MDNKEKTPEQKAAEKLMRAQAIGNAISHFSMKLGVIKNETPIEEQLKLLSDYHNAPSIEEIKGASSKELTNSLSLLNFITIPPV